VSEQVLCMVRGGEAGRATQEAAIEYVKLQEKKLVFMHVIDPQRLSLNSEEQLAPAEAELTWLGHITLSMARQRANNKSINPRLLIRKGPIFDVVLDFLQENKVEKVFLGLPREVLEDYEERRKLVERFAERITKASDVPVEMVKTDC